MTNEAQIPTLAPIPAVVGVPSQRPDGAFLHFLKELPAWCVIGIFVGAFLTVWQFSHDDFIPRILDGLIGALLTAIVSNRPKTPTIQAGQISTGTGNIGTEVDSEKGA